MRINKAAFQIALAKKMMNAADLCKVAKISDVTISNGINGKANLTPKTVGRIAAALECDVETLVEKEA